MHCSDKVLSLIGVLGLFCCLTGCHPENLERQKAEQALPNTCHVLKVYDGDTFSCDLNGNGHLDWPEESIRMLGIDSPEMHYSKKNKTYDTDHPTDEPYAREASEWLHAQLDHHTVFLKYDQRHTDRYGRTLAYVYRKSDDTTSLNEMALRQGYAKLLILGKNRLYEEPFRAAAKAAKKAKQGLWGVPRGDEIDLDD